MSELLSCKSPSLIGLALSKTEVIAYSENGNRIQTAKKSLELATAAAKKVGITRVADISHLDPSGISVFQTSRPNTEDHISFGQNTGSQGKGLTQDQAKISAVMESIETFCLETRNADLIRGSYEYLSQQHLVIHPRHFLLNPVSGPVIENENLMWTNCYHVQTKENVLIPAETVFFPFRYNDYSVERHFTCGSNGLASGLSYLEAINHALHEVIERFYFSELQLHSEKLEIKRIDLTMALASPVFEFCRHILPSLKVFRVRIKENKNIPFYLCLYKTEDRLVAGRSCGPTAQVAVQRAITEAVQVVSSLRSGSREDMAASSFEMTAAMEAEFKKRSPELGKSEVLPADEFEKDFSSKNFSSLNQEFEWLCEFLASHGYLNIFIANLTRKGIDIPVVKVVVPGLPSEFKVRMLKASHYSSVNSNGQKFGFGDAL